MWQRRVSLAAGLVLVLSALLLPAGWLVVTLAGPEPERLGQLTTGALLFKVGLLLHGLLLIGIGWSWRARAGGEGSPVTSFWTPRQPDDSGRRKETALILIGLLGVGALLRIINLNSGLWYDEVTTLLEFVRPPVGQIITSFSTDNQHALYSLLAHYSIGIFGESPWALRLPAVLFGLGSLWALYGLGRVIAGRREAILATALLTVSYHHIWFSQNARGYTGLLFWTLLGTWLLIVGLQSGRRRHWLGYVLAMTLAIYTHLAAVFVVLSHAIVYGWLLARSENRTAHGGWRPLWAFALVGSLSFQLYALALPQAIGSVVDDGTTVPSDWTNPLWTLAETLRGLQVGFAGVGALIAAALLFGSGLLSYLRENRTVVALLILPGLLGAIAIVLLQHNFWPRFFFYALGFAVLIAVRGAMVFGKIAAQIIAPEADRAPLARGIGTALACMLVLLSASSLGFNYRYPKQDYLGALAYLEEWRQPGEPVVTVGLASVPYRRYYAPELEQVTTLEQLEAVRARGRATWLLYTFPIYMKAHYPDILAAIKNDFIVMEKFPGTVGDGTIYVCRAEPPAPGRVTGSLTSGPDPREHHR